MLLLMAFPTWQAFAMSHRVSDISCWMIAWMFVIFSFVFSAFLGLFFAGLCFALLCFGFSLVLFGCINRTEHCSFLYAWYDNWTFVVIRSLVSQILRYWSPLVLYFNTLCLIIDLGVFLGQMRSSSVFSLASVGLHSAYLGCTYQSETLLSIFRHSIAVELN